jgi:serine protease Do
MQGARIHVCSTSRSVIVPWLAFLLSVTGAVLLSGCATVRSKPQEGVDLGRYRRVILSEMDENGDPRKVIPKVVERLRAIGFSVQTLKAGETAESQGTGFIISEQGHLLTCAHVLGGKPQATVWLGERRFAADLVTLDTNRDLALLRLREPPKDLVPAFFASGKPVAMGQDAYTMGFPLSDILGTSPRLTKGLISSAVGLGDNPEQLQISAEVQPGNSGGPLFNQNGETVGMITSSLNAMNILARTGASLPQNVNFALKVEAIRDFLSKAGIGVREPASVKEPEPFDRVKASVVLVRAGDVAARTPSSDLLSCQVRYQYFWDIWYRFQTFELVFRDVKNGEVVLRAGQYGDNAFSGEEAVIDKVTDEVRAKFFPGSKPLRNLQRPSAEPNRK